MGKNTTKIVKNIICGDQRIPIRLLHDLRMLDIKQSMSPRVDSSIDILRRKYNIVIYNSIEPFVDPTSSKPRILYRYAVKYCNLRDGWNGRVYIGESKLVPNPYTAKKQAIGLAIKWIKNNLQPKSVSGSKRNTKNVN